MTAREIDRGREVIAHLHEVLALDESSCERTDRGFTWWGENHAQKVWAERAVNRDGVRAWKVHARTDLLADFVATKENLGVLTEYGAHAILGGGLIRDGNQPNRIQLGACLYATDSTLDWAKGFFPTVAATQAAEAHLVATELAAMAGCKPAYTNPPGGTPTRHRALGVLGSWVRGGRNAPVWTADEFLETAEEIESAQPFAPSATDSGIRIELPFADSKALCEMTIRNEHPTYHNGLFVRLALPIVLSETQDPEIVLRCNKLELNSLTNANHCTGSWYADEDAFRYTNFIPNLPSFQGVPFLASMIQLMSSRARWFAEIVRDGDWPILQSEDKPQTWLN